MSTSAATTNEYAERERERANKTVSSLSLLSLPFHFSAPTGVVVTAGAAAMRLTAPSRFFFYPLLVLFH